MAMDRRSVDQSMGGLKKKGKKEEEEESKKRRITRAAAATGMSMGLGLDGWVDCENMCNLSCARLVGVLCMYWYVCMQKEGNE